jgi:hypothetical protein
VLTRRSRALLAALCLVLLAAGLAAGGLATAAEIPVANTPAPITTSEDVAVQITLSGSDADGDELTFSISTEPAVGTVVPQDPGQCTPAPPDPCDVVVTYTPADDANGPDSFQFTVTDGVDGTSSPAAVDITITPVDDAPVADDDNMSGLEDQPLDVFVLDNDTDVDGDLLMVSDATDGVHGIVAIVGAGNNIRVQYTPEADFNGSDSFTYTANDSHGGSDTAAVSITIDPVNDDPVADDDAATGFEDQPRSVPVLDGDTDVDGDALSITGTTDGAHGTVGIVATGNGPRAQYRPDADFSGADAFTYTVGDGHGGSATATVSITITPVNDAPTIFVPFEPIVAEDSGQHSFGGFLDGDAGPPDEDFTQNVDFVIDDVSPASLFSIQPAVNPNGTLSFRPAPNANGTATVTARSTDSGGTANGGVDMSPPQQFTITVTPVNDAPAAVDDGTPTAVKIPQNAGPTPVAVLANDSAVDAGELLAMVAVSQATHGTVAITGGGSGLTYDPTGSYTGADAFTYTISDGALQATATVHINVTPDITGPVASIRVVGVAARDSVSLRVTVTWSAIETQSGVARYQLQQQTDHGAWVTITLTPVNATRVERVVGGGHDYAFRVRAFDGIGNQGAYATSATLRL